MLARIQSFLFGLFHRTDVENGLDEELRTHILERADTLEASGLGRAEALRRARLEFGGMETYKENCREARGLRWPDELRQDLRYAARMARRSPGFTAVAVLSLALGIGANTAMFSILNSLLLTPLPVRDPGRLVSMQVWHDRGPGADSFPLYVRLRSGLSGKLLEDVCGTGSPEAVTVTLPGAEALRAVRASVTTSYFDVLGVPLLAGRGFDTEEKIGSPLTAVISERFWRTRFNADPAALGKPLRIGGTTATVVGITSGEFAGVEIGNAVDLWTNATAMDPRQLTEHWNFLHVFGRMRAGVGLRETQAALSTVFQNYQRERAAANADDTRGNELLAKQRIRATSGSTGVSRLRDRFTVSLEIVSGVVALVLLIACANITNLLLARAAKRQREIATRLSLGAGSSRLFRQFLTESLALAACGSLLGLAVAVWTSRHLLDLIPQGEIPLSLDVHLSWRVLLFTSAVAMGAGLLFGIVPAMRVSRSQIATAMKFSGASDFGGASGGLRPGRLLSVAQIALSTLLVFGAGLFVRTLQHLRGVDAGFRVEHAVTFDLIPPSSFSEKQKQEARRLVVERMSALPGVTSAAISWPGAFNEGEFTGDIKVPGANIPDDTDHDVNLMLITPGFFRTMGGTILRGREFDTDARKNTNSVIINERFAALYFAGKNPLGMTIQPYPRNTPPVFVTVVGVVRDIRHYGLRENVRPAIYLPMSEMEPPWAPTVELRLERDLGAMAKSIRRTVAEIGPGLEVENLGTLDQRINAYLEKERMLAAVAGLFSSIALLLAAVGLYGVMAYAVARRTKEFGLRMALGAQRRRVLEMILRDGVGTASVGVVIGILAAVALSRVAAALLFGVKAGDAESLAAPVAIMLATALIAVLAPAWRATRVDPMVALREE